MKRYLVREMCKKRREEKGDRGWGRRANELGFGIPVPYSSHNYLSSFCSAPQTNKTRRHGELLLNQNEHRNRRKHTNKHKKHTLTFNVICRCISPWAVCGTARGTCPTQAFKYLKCYQHWIIQVNFRLPLPNAEAHSVPRNMLRFGRSLSVWILIDCVELAIQVVSLI